MEARQRRAVRDAYRRRRPDLDHRLVPPSILTEEGRHRASPPIVQAPLADANLPRKISISMRSSTAEGHGIRAPQHSRCLLLFSAGSCAGGRARSLRASARLVSPSTEAASTIRWPSR